MLDYPALAALAAVIETQSFHQAAEKLFVTQSAVSQRIKALENYYGEPLLIRSLPYRSTRLGTLLLEHFRRTMLLEDTLQASLAAPQYQQRICIAISRDSLETWFVQVLEELKNIPAIKLEIMADDQDVTISYLRNGFVSACASNRAKHLSGCKTDFLGYFDYVLVASPAFKEKYFKNKNHKANLSQAPAIIFDDKDQLHADYLRHFFDMDDTHIQYHVVPSVAGFRQFALNGYAYALIPKIDILPELKQHKLVNLFPDKVWQMPVYWHSWNVESRVYRIFNELVLKVGRKTLRQK